MLIALDYDGTYTRDPVTWIAVVRMFQDAGHEVICATMRYEHETEEMCGELKATVKVICTERKAKSAALRMMGITPDIWIDDNPGWLFEDAL